MTCIVGNSILRKDFWISAPKNLGIPKTTYFRPLNSQLSGNFEDQYLRRGTWYKQSENVVGNYKKVFYIVPKLLWFTIG